MVLVSPQSSTRSWRPPPGWSDPIFESLDGLAAEVVRGELSQSAAVFALEAITLEAADQPADPEIRAVFRVALHVFWQRLRAAIARDNVRQYAFEQVLYGRKVQRAAVDRTVTDEHLAALVRQQVPAEVAQ